MAAAKRRASCRELLKKFNILPLASKFLLSSSFVVDSAIIIISYIFINVALYLITFYTSLSGIITYNYLITSCILITMRYHTVSLPAYLSLCGNIPYHFPHIYHCVVPYPITSCILLQFLCTTL
jgi:hypothetical protein